MTRLKALSVIQCREYVLEKHGPEGIERVKAELSPLARQRIYADELLATDWLEVEYGLAHAKAYDRAFGSGDGRASSEMIRALAARHFTTLYRTMVSRDTPLSCLDKSSRLWSRYYDQGEIELVLNSPTHVIKRLRGCPDMPRDHDWLTNPYYEEMVRQCGAKDVTVRHPRCVALGADCCETSVRWRE
jgi:hypothetical protein